MDLLIRINLANILIQKRLQIHQYDMSQCAAAKRKKYYCLEGFNKVFRFSILIVIIWTFRLIKTRLIILHCHLQTSIRLQHFELCEKVTLRLLYLWRISCYIPILRFQEVNTEVFDMSTPYFYFRTTPRKTLMNMQILHLHWDRCMLIAKR